MTLALNSSLINKLLTEANDDALGEEGNKPTTENGITHDKALKHATCLLD